MFSAAASLGLSLLWDTDVGLSHIDKYAYASEDHIKVCSLPPFLVNLLTLISLFLSGWCYACEWTHSLGSTNRDGCCSSIIVGTRRVEECTFASRFNHRVSP